jgi:hypothetical protein
MAEKIPRGSGKPIELEAEEGDAGQELCLILGKVLERIGPLTEVNVAEQLIEKVNHRHSNITVKSMSPGKKPLNVRYVDFSYRVDSHHVVSQSECVDISVESPMPSP